jgi:hypothetical protein
MLLGLLLVNPDDEEEADEIDVSASSETSA